MKGWLGLILGILLGILGTIGGYILLKETSLGDDGVTVTFTEEEVQARLGEKFPKTEMIYDLFPATIGVPQVRFLGDTNRLELSIQAHLAVPLTPGYEIAGVFTSSLRYEQDDQTLRIDDVTVERISATNLPAKFEEPVRLALTGAARKYLDDHKVHQIDDDDYKEEMVRMVLREVKVKSGRLEVRLAL